MCGAILLEGYLLLQVGPSLASGETREPMREAIDPACPMMPQPSTPFPGRSRCQYGWPIHKACSPRGISSHASHSPDARLYPTLTISRLGGLAVR